MSSASTTTTTAHTAAIVRVALVPRPVSVQCQQHRQRRERGHAQPHDPTEAERSELVSVGRLRCVIVGSSAAAPRTSGGAMVNAATSPPAPIDPFSSAMPLAASEIRSSPTPVASSTVAGTRNLILRRGTERDRQCERVDHRDEHRPHPIAERHATIGQIGLDHREPHAEARRRRRRWWSRSDPTNHRRATSPGRASRVR